MDTLTGKVAVVTGASKGIGAALAKGLAAAGAAVAVNYAADREGAERTVAEITRGGGKAAAIQADVSKAADVKRLFAETQKAVRPVYAGSGEGRPGAGGRGREGLSRGIYGTRTPARTDPSAPSTSRQGSLLKQGQPAAMIRCVATTKDQLCSGAEATCRGAVITRAVSKEPLIVTGHGERLVGQAKRPSGEWRWRPHRRLSSMPTARCSMSIPS